MVYTPFMYYKTIQLSVAFKDMTSVVDVEMAKSLSQHWHTHICRFWLYQVDVLLLPL